MRTKKKLAMVMALVLTICSMWMQPVTAEAATGNISVSGVNTSGNVVLDETGTKTLSVGNLSSFGADATAEWTLGAMKIGNNGPEFQTFTGVNATLYTKNSDGSITLNGSGLATVKDQMNGNEAKNFQIRVSVYATDPATSAKTEMDNTTIEGYLVEAFGDTYDLPLTGEADRIMLVGDQRSLGKSLYAERCSEDQPHAGMQWLSVQSVQLQNQTVTNGSGNMAFSLNATPDGWNIVALEPGSADLVISYNDLDNNPASHTVHLESRTLVYELNCSWKNDCRWLLPGGMQTEVTVSLMKRWAEGPNSQHSDWSTYAEEIDSGYTLGIKSGSYDANMIACSVNGSGQVILQSGSKMGEAAPILQATGTDGGASYSCETSLDVTVTDDYYALEGSLNENCELGEVVDPASDLKLYHYTYENNTQNRTQVSAGSDIRFRLEYSSADWKAVNTSALPPLQRINTSGVQLRYVAEKYDANSGSWNEILVNRNFWFGWQDYNVRWRVMNPVVYTGEDAVLDLEAESLKDKSGCVLDFAVGQIENGQFTPLSNQSTLFTVQQDNGLVTGIKLHTDAVLAQFAGADACNVVVRLNVTSNGIAVHQNLDQDIAIEQGGCDYMYEWMDVLELMPGSMMSIGEMVEYRLRSNSQPGNMSGTVQISDLKVDILNGDADVAWAEPLQGGGWDLFAGSPGSAKVTVTHKDAADPSKTVTTSFIINVVEECWGLNAYYENNTSVILRGEERTITVEPWRTVINENGELMPGDTSKTTILWDYPASSVFTFTTVGNKITIKASSTAGMEAMAGFVAHVCPVDDQGNVLTDNGQPIILATEFLEVTVQDGYYMVEPLSVNGNMAVGTSLTIVPTVKYVTNDANGNKVATPIQGAMVGWEWPANMLEIKDDQDNVIPAESFVEAGKTYTITRQQCWGPEVGLIGAVFDDNQMLIPVTRSNWRFDELDQEITVKADADGDGVKESVDVIFLKVGETIQLEGAADPAKLLDYSELIWNSLDANEEVIKVSASGQVTGVAAGAASIELELEYNGPVAELQVVVCKVTGDIEDPITGEEAKKPVTQISVVESSETEKQAELAVKELMTKMATVEEGTAEWEEKVKGAVSDPGILTAIEDAVENGKEIKAQVQVEEMSAADVAAISGAVKTEMMAAAGTALGKDAKLQYLDISLLLAIDGVTVGKLEELETPIKITIAVPEAIKNKAGKYAVVREHDGEIDILSEANGLLTVNPDGTISIWTDRLSTYSLAYAEKVVQQDDDDDDDDNSAPSQVTVISKAPGTSAPNTGDDSQAGSLTWMLFAAVLMLTGLFAGKRKA